MGCHGSKPVTYTFDKELRTISRPKAHTLHRWALGALARNRFKKLKKQLLTNLAYLPKPVLRHGVLTYDHSQPLWSEEEFEAYYEQESKKYLWESKFTDISEEGCKKAYAGQRPKKHLNSYEGLGTIRFEEGSIYEGQVKDKLFNGKGRLSHTNGDIYQGEWKNGMANGKGIYIQPDSNQFYDGDWVDDEHHGEGTESWSNGTMVYTGEFINGQRTGHGTFLNNGHKYTGEFVDSEFHGHGRYENPEKGRILEGEFQNNNFIRGKMFFDDGSVYEGEFKQDLMHGAGSLTYPNGNIYIGTFQDDQKHGMGTLFDVATNTKQREEWLRGTLKNFVKTPTSKEEIEQQRRKPGYNYQQRVNYLQPDKRWSLAGKASRAATRMRMSSKK